MIGVLIYLPTISSINKPCFLIFLKIYLDWYCVCTPRDKLLIKNAQSNLVDCRSRLNRDMYLIQGSLNDC